MQKAILIAAVLAAGVFYYTSDIVRNNYVTEQKDTLLGTARMEIASFSEQNAEHIARELPKIAERQKTRDAARAAKVKDTLEKSVAAVDVAIVALAKELEKKSSGSAAPPGEEGEKDDEPGIEDLGFDGIVDAEPAAEAAEEASPDEEPPLKEADVRKLLYGRLAAITLDGALGVGKDVSLEIYDLANRHSILSRTADDFTSFREEIEDARRLNRTIAGFLY